MGGERGDRRGERGEVKRESVYFNADLNLSVLNSA